MLHNQAKMFALTAFINHLATGGTPAEGDLKLILLKSAPVATENYYGDIAAKEIVAENYTAGGKIFNDVLAAANDGGSPWTAWIEAAITVTWADLGETPSDTITYVACYEAKSPFTIIGSKAVTSKTTNGSTINVTFPVGSTGTKGRVVQL